MQCQSISAFFNTQCFNLIIAQLYLRYINIKVRAIKTQWVFNITDRRFSNHLYLYCYAKA